MTKSPVPHQLSLLSPTSAPFIIAEVAQAHDGSLGTAHAYIDAISRTGANAVKFQTHVANAESSPSEPWRVKFSYQDETRFDYWKRMEFTPNQWAGLKTHAEEKGLVFLSSPFSLEAVEILQRIGMGAWKIASGEINNPILLDAILALKQPVLLSTGMSPLPEIREAVSKIQSHHVPFALLQCSSIYPCPPEKVGLNMLATFREEFSCAVGISDHSGTIFPSLAAAALGANVFEVHVTLSRDAFGPDVVASVTMEEMKTLVDGVRFTEKMLANPLNKDQSAADLATIRGLFMRSLFFTRDLPAGTTLKMDDLIAKKPGTGVASKHIQAILGTKLKSAGRAGEMLRLEQLESVPAELHMKVAEK